MELIRTDSDYALRAMLQLARSGQWLSCAVLAKEGNIPKSFAYKIMRKMVAAGLVESNPGRTGGFRLLKQPAQITLLDVLDVIQGPLAVRRCVLDGGACRNSNRCVLSARWRTLQQEITRFFEGTTLADILASADPGGTPVGAGTTVPRPAMKHRTRRK